MYLELENSLGGGERAIVALRTSKKPFRPPLTYRYPANGTLEGADRWVRGIYTSSIRGSFHLLWICHLTMHERLSIDRISWVGDRTYFRLEGDGTLQSGIGRCPQ